MEFYNLNTGLGYVFGNIENAETKRELVNSFFQNETSTTTEFASIITCAKFGKFFIIHQDYMTPLLGEPTQIEYFTPKPSPINF